MSAQGATLGRGTVRIPIWPVAVVVLAAATAAVIGLSSIDTIAPARPVTIVTDAQRLANSTAAVREQGAVAPVVIGISHVTPRAIEYVPAVDFPGPYGVPVTEAVGISHVTPRAIEYVPAVDFPGPYGVPAVFEQAGSVSLPDWMACDHCQQRR
jgi:hypothetical protein